MQLTPQTSDMVRYLASSEIIDFENLDIQKTAMYLSKGIEDEIQLIKTVYGFVRDDISHSIDIGSNEVTYLASDVLKYKHGLCFANSHLLAAILRYLGVPTGFCYQKLEFEGKMGLHGLNAVFIESIDKWIRLDARGNENGINAQFSIDKEYLAYSPKEEKNEVDFGVICAEPDKRVVEILRHSRNLDEALDRIFDTNWLLK
ncbi:transglutaminase-like domain-containing protein [Methanobacterium sp.]|uniref:transglutaminase-like domain-containing protein n=1 Tax=Methanobacterium sp. TaxID=2164 RepID=UPI003C715D09